MVSRIKMLCHVKHKRIHGGAMWCTAVQCSAAQRSAVHDYYRTAVCFSSELGMGEKTSATTYYPATITHETSNNNIKIENKV